MAKVDRLIEHAKEHLDKDENIVAVVMGAYEVKRIASDNVRTGIFIATETRLVFYAKKLMGFDLESFPYSNISSIEMSKGFMGHSIKFFSYGNKAAMKWINDKDSREKNINGFVEFIKNNLVKTTLKNDTSLVDDIPSQIKKLSDLKDQGILTESEFTNKKQELLARL